MHNGGEGHSAPALGAKAASQEAAFSIQGLIGSFFTTILRHLFGFDRQGVEPGAKFFGQRFIDSPVSRQPRKGA